MPVPEDLMYSADHKWVRLTDGGIAAIGVTDYAQRAFGDIIFVNLCMAGAKIDLGDLIGDVESVTAVSDLVSPVDGFVLKVNADALESPEMINQKPYDAWLVEVGPVSDFSALMDADAYAALIDAQ